MKKKIILLYFLVILHIADILGKDPICISLGDACGPALMLRNLKIRTEAFPFDWLVSPFDAFYQALVSDFSLFLADLTMRPDKTGVIDHYGLHFTHDWPTIHNPHIDALGSDYISNCKLLTEWEQVLPLVREKYKRRIERFKKICLGEDKVIFIRGGSFLSAQEEAILIRDFFRDKYPTLEFILLVISSQEEFKVDWELENIRNFYLKEWHDPAGLADILKKIDPTFTHLLKKDITVTEAEFDDMTCNRCLASSD